ncbi:MAG: amidophosphoribosyltransferase [Bacteriovoracaceae bacterium]|nr:amidophosphoribosyltransferase [Bacteriovoracaceae bacterium]
MCGIIGVIGTSYAAQEVYQGLLLLQHRGQDSAGILSYDFHRKTYHQHKDLGQVSQVFDLKTLERLEGQMSLGHTRYSTVGGSQIKDVQPLVVGYPFGLGIVHNGNLVNFYQLREKLSQQSKRHIFSNNDLEALLNLMAAGLIESKNEALSFDDITHAVSKIYDAALGGYSVLVSIADHGLLAFRDPNGIRPLVWGEKELSEAEKKQSGSSKAYCFSSESNALNFLGYKLNRDLKPGEVVFISKTGQVFQKVLNQQTTANCMFEYIYFATPESTMETKNVYQVRLQMGQALAEQIEPLIASGEITPDVIVPVPETSRVSAISLSEKLGIPYREVLIKNRYIQRSFILNTPESRKRAVQLKLTPVASEIKGKKILLVDDSIVRGTTSKRIIEMVRDAGAKEVYIATTCPPIRHPCFYGIDFPNPEELVAYKKTEEEIAANQKADRVVYMSLDGLLKSIGKKDLCLACITGKYPVDISAGESFSKKREKDRTEEKL